MVEYPYNYKREPAPEYGLPGVDSLQETIDMGTCIIPVLAKYTIYATTSVKEKPPDEMVNDLFETIDIILHNHKDENGKLLTGKSSICQKEDPGLVYKDLCPLLKTFEKAKTRFDKVEAIEAAIAAEHSEGVGSVLEYGCETLNIAYREYERTLTLAILDLLFGEEKE